MNISKSLLEGMEEVRSSGQVNMMDKRGVVQVLESLGYYDEAEDIQNCNPDEYFSVLESM